MCKDWCVKTYSYTIQYVPDHCENQETYDKGADTCPFLFDSVPDQYITQEMHDKIVSGDPFMLKYCIDEHYCNVYLTLHLVCLYKYP